MGTSLNAAGYRSGIAENLFPRRNSRMPPQLEKNHVVPTSWQDEALARHGKILQAKLQQYMNQEIPDVQAGFRKGRGLMSPSLINIFEKEREK